MKQTSECVGKLNVADIYADRSWWLFKCLNSTAGDSPVESSRCSQ
ncbi:hypothetical protein [Chamaesiphon sp. VAR_48_metabat_403]|nr:hypothetical protein [Chamaesiphon sp. VAR_48_metabat_403]